MKKLTILLMSAFLCILLTANSTFSQDTAPGAVDEESKFSMDVTLNSDMFFGFYPFFAGSYSLSEKSAFTFYGILWSGGVAQAWGNWTEFGMGINYSPFEGLDINPQIGLLSGSLLSGLGRAEVGDGIVPNLTVGLDLDHVEGELYAGYYLGFEHGNPSTLNYLHYWANTGYKFGSGFFSAGLHFEHLRFMGGSNIEDGNDLFMSFGPYVQFANPNGGGFARFHGGPNLADPEKGAVDNSTFWKLTVGYSF
ncbi:MAG: DUF6733 family protein [Cytophagaceae bacterium]